MTKLQLTLTDQEVNLLSARAARLGYNLTRFVKFLVSQEATKFADQPNVPVFTMSKRAEAIALQARRDHLAGKSIPFSSIKDLDLV